MKTEHLGYEKLRGHYPGLFLSYCLDEPRAQKFFAYRYRDERSLQERAKRAADRGVERSLIEILKGYHLEHGAPTDSMSSGSK